MAAGSAAIRIESPEDTDEDLRHLARWLRDEDELRSRVGLTTENLQQDHMGGLVETVTVVLTSGTAAALVTSLFDWLGRRKEVGKVTVRVESSTGERVELECGSSEDAERLLKACREVL